MAADAPKVSDLAKNLVGSLSVVLSDIDSRTATITFADANGATSVKGGLLTGDSGVRSVRQKLVEAATYPVDGASPSSVGIVLGRDGTVTFDAEKFATAVAKDPSVPPPLSKPSQAGCRTRRTGCPILTKDR